MKISVMSSKDASKEPIPQSSPRQQEGIESRQARKDKKFLAICWKHATSNVVTSVLVCADGTMFSINLVHTGIWPNLIIRKRG